MHGPDEVKEVLEEQAEQSAETLAHEAEVSAELDRVFDHHPPPANVAEVHSIWRKMIKAVATDLMGLPATRERAMALTRLEECSFWIQATIARNHGAFEGKEPPPEADAED